MVVPRPQVPRTDYGGAALFQCKDGFVLKGENTTTCHFGNWTGVTPSCELVYCKFPGYIERGKVLLVGNMGLYDYRAYVRKVKNNRQILFECGRGYKLADGPPGATCIDGKWSPPDLPRCVDEFHPKMVQWKRRRRRRAVDGAGGDGGGGRHQAEWGAFARARLTTCFIDARPRARALGLSDIVSFLNQVGNAWVVTEGGAAARSRHRVPL